MRTVEIVLEQGARRLRFVPREQVEAKKPAIIQERLAKLVPMDAEIAKALVMKPNTFEIVPVK